MFKLIASLALLAASPALAVDVQPALTGATRIHDPSIIVIDGMWVAFGTGNAGVHGGAILVKTSADGLQWADAGAIGEGIPEWVASTTDVRPRELWAPSAAMRDRVVYLYYAASTFGSNTSAIGLATNAHLDPLKPTEGWVECGLVLATGPGKNYNAIDPTRIDTPDGRAFLAFGSFWSGIKMVELDPASGLLKQGADLVSLASRGGGAIEAASLLRHGDAYYLFVSFDRCCAGVASTYRIMVGRSDIVTGPYVAKDGTPMMAGGGTEVQKTIGRFIGPGGQEAFPGPGGDWLAYHYYDGDDAGVSKLQVAPIRWDADGWPSLDPLPLAPAN